MHVDQPGDERHVAEVDASGIHRRGAADRGDATVSDGDRRTLDDRAFLDIEHPGGGDDHRLGSGRDGRHDGSGGKQHGFQETPPVVPIARDTPRKLDDIDKEPDHIPIGKPVESGQPKKHDGSFSGMASIKLWITCARTSSQASGAWA